MNEAKATACAEALFGQGCDALAGALGATGLSNQHGGAAGTETMWLSFPATSPPLWLAPHGGSLREGISSLAKLVGQGP